MNLVLIHKIIIDAGKYVSVLGLSKLLLVNSDVHWQIMEMWVKLEHFFQRFVTYPVN